MLFEARTRVLRHKTYRARYQEIDMVFGACGKEEETAECLILYFKGLHHVVAEEVESPPPYGSYI